MCLRISSILFLIVLALPSLGAQTKQDNHELKKDLETYKRATIELDFDGLIAFLPPQMLDMIPADALKEQLEQAFDNEELYMLLDSMVYGEIPAVEKAGEHLYAIVPYSGHMEMHFKEPRDSAFMESMVPMLEAQFAKDNVHIMKANTELFLSIDLRDKKLIAFKNAGFDSWKFIDEKRDGELPEDDPQLMMVKTFVPAEVLDATK